MYITKEMLEKALVSLTENLERAKKSANEGVQAAAAALEETKARANQHVGEAQGRINAVKAQLEMLSAAEAKSTTTHDVHLTPASKLAHLQPSADA